MITATNFATKNTQRKLYIHITLQIESRAARVKWGSKSTPHPQKVIGNREVDSMQRIHVVVVCMQYSFTIKFICCKFLQVFSLQYSVIESSLRFHQHGCGINKASQKTRTVLNQRTIIIKKRKKNVQARVYQICLYRVRIFRGVGNIGIQQQYTIN